MNRQKNHIIITDNIRSAQNIGSIFRTCDALGYQKIYLCGISATPPNKEIAKQFYSDTIKHLFENETTKANDELWAIKQAEYKTYALMQPLFYQKCIRNEPYTNFKIN